MELIYQLMETLLPVSWIHYDFMKNALLAVLMIAPLFGLMGTMVVNNGMAFFSDAVGHSALCGIAIGVVLGLSDTTPAMIAFAVLFAVGLNLIRQTNHASADTIISVFSSLGVAAGLAILSRGGDFSRYSGMLVGDILSIAPRELAYLAGALVLTVIFWLFGFNALHAVSVNRSLARSRRIPVAVIDMLFAVLIAVIVTLSIKWIGLLMINAMLILPAAASRNISSTVREYHLYSILFSCFSGITGLVMSYYLNIASGPMIVILAAAVFFVTHLFRGRARN
ncbi:MAG: metal ABC transporter permease [Clostridia bacterium]|nr:metal ABC transporter permease [Clostridia bacterium]